MADFAGIGAALSGLKTMLDLAKGVQDAHIARKISEEVANIQGRLIDVQQQTLAFQQENEELRREIAAHKSFVQHHSVMWRKLPDGKEDGPSCPVCIADRREMRLIIVEKWDQKGDSWCVYCPQGHERAFYVETPPGPYYHIPKSLFPVNYFSVPGVSE
jgi:hypothetical protein